MRVTTQAGALVAVALLAGCSSSHAPVATKTTSPHPTSSRAATSTCSPSALVNRMSLPQLVGQVFMVGTATASNSADLIRDIGAYHVGGAFLYGHSMAPASAIATQTARIQHAANSVATNDVKLLISTDQEGGKVQVLHGAGFSQIPNALAQAAQAPATLQSKASIWGKELAAAGITMNLAPVADNVLPQNRRTNAPIGQLMREYGATAKQTGPYAAAFAHGMASAGVIPTTKHFPGLGNVLGNTDFSAHVHDASITAADPNIASYVQAASANDGFVMMSSAIYDRIDKTQPAVFSPKVINLLRAQGFHGPIITDDFTSARAVTIYSPGERAIRAISAGVDVVLLQDSSTVPAMFNALLTKAQSDTAFRNRLKDAVGAILEAKQKHHLLPATCN